MAPDDVPPAQAGPIKLDYSPLRPRKRLTPIRIILAAIAIYLSGYGYLRASGRLIHYSSAANGQFIDECLFPRFIKTPRFILLAYKPLMLAEETIRGMRTW